tara:strand:+ start:488 stop:1111 length:624 start_codon:yes stop_codon:yes gene_type:complete
MFLNNVKQLFLAIFVCLIAVSCDGGDSDHDHTEDGLAIYGDYNAGIAMVEIEGQAHEHDGHAAHMVVSGFSFVAEGEESYTYRQLDLAVDGEISLSVGEAKEYTIYFLDSDGNPIEEDDDHSDEEHCEDFLTESDCGMHSECEWHADEDACEDAEGDHDGHDHGDEEHGMHITIEGVSVGTMEFQFSLMHEGHLDFTSLPIVVNVVE